MALPFKRVQLQPLTPVELEGLDQLRQKYEQGFGVPFMDWFRLHHIPRVLHGKLDRSPETLALMQQAALTLLQEAQFINRLFDLQIPDLANPQPATKTSPAQTVTLSDSAPAPQLDSDSTASSETGREGKSRTGARAIEWNID